MSYLNQKTIKIPISFSGIGLHTGKEAKVLIKPALPDTGIVFKRVDISENNFVYPNYINVSNTSISDIVKNIIEVLKKYE